MNKGTMTIRLFFFFMRPPDLTLQLHMLHVLDLSAHELLAGATKFFHRIGRKTLYAWLFTVPSVAMTTALRDLLTALARSAPGSITPRTLTSTAFAMASNASALAVLHAITRCSAPFRCRYCALEMAYRATVSADF